MNPVGKPAVLKANFKLLSLLGAIGLFIFLLLQVILPTLAGNQELVPKKTISDQEAVSSATTFIKETLGYQVETPANPLVTYRAHSDLYGYLMKNELLAEYNRTWVSEYPYDLFRVHIPYDDINATLRVDLDMVTGKAVGFVVDRGTPSFMAEGVLEDETSDTMLRFAEGSISLADKQAEAKAVLTDMGYDPATLELLTSDGDTGLLYRVTNHQIGEAPLELKFLFENGKIRSFEPMFVAPKLHTDYVKQQTAQANWMYYIGFALFTFVLGVLAIVYSIVKRSFTSFGRGIVLSIVYFLASMISFFNMLPVFQSESTSSFMLVFLIIFQTIITIVMAGSVYFSLVGGNALWREHGWNPWPRAKEPGYGLYVLRSMWAGYLWAFILLGVQSIIFVILGMTIGTWSTTDETQSPFNMTYAWVLPIMAWMAGIGEEAVYRFFGIAMVKRMVRSTLVASIITSLIWAFGHTLYPIYPVITRPIELLFIGLLFSFIFLRYGFITVMFSHVVFNSILMGISLMTMGQLSNVTAGVVGIILPAIVGYIVYKYNPTQKEKSYPTTPPEGQL
ncbi:MULTISPECIES: CPBP family intramembrane glutamic endopeptidase [Paenibacillus]|uniref:CPBP family intramembrane glutamic endopeptidase n=1 Tax=Paenibacillus TaxID=44249 RepID=UPI00036E145C|nr:CPBP family intramembrane glutamic endopeptidase [Paenibacillus massiliensis]